VSVDRAITRAAPLLGWNPVFTTQPLLQESPKEKLVTRRATVINCNNPPECHLHAATLPSMSAPGHNPAGASGPDDDPRPANYPPEMNASGTNPADASGAGDRPRPATNPPNMRRNLAGAYPMPSTQSLDNHLNHGSIFGAAINNINIDPALFGSQQGASSQAATQHFNFSPGSHAQLSFQHISGNGASHQPTYQAPVEDDFEVGKEAYLGILKDLTNHFDDSDDEGDSSSKVVAEKLAARLPQPSETVNDTAYLHGSIPSSIHGQPLPPTPNDLYSPPLHSESNLYSGIQTQQQSSMHTLNSACVPTPRTSYEQHPVPHNTAHVPNSLNQHRSSSLAVDSQAMQKAFENSKGGQTVSNTQGYQASLAQTQAPVSLAPFIHA
jgi:hypothetical protein